MTRRRSAPVPRSRFAPRRAASVLVGASFLALSACSGGSPSATKPTSPSTSKPPVTPVSAACAPSSVAASVVFTKFGGSSSSLAGAVLFRNTSGTACSMRGVPQVQVLTLTGQPIPTYEAPGPAQVVPVVLTPAAPAGTGTRAASSITFSSWTCTPGSFSLSVRLPGWPSPVPATESGSTTSTTGPVSNVTGPPCSATQEIEETVYMGPVTSVT